MPTPHRSENLSADGEDAGAVLAIPDGARQRGEGAARSEAEGEEGGRQLRGQADEQIDSDGQVVRGHKT